LLLLGSCSCTGGGVYDKVCKERPHPRLPLASIL
jgi:hypothetical protein